MKIRSVLLAATFLALPMAVMAAEPVTGPYISLGAGFDYLNQLNAKSVVFAGAGNAGENISTSGKFQSSGGWALVGAGGWGFGNGLRAEIEGNFAQNHVKVNGTYAGGGGTYQQMGVMVNGLYDFTMIAPWVSPYVGLGFGYIWNEFNNTNIYSNTPLLAHQATLAMANSTKGSAASQAIIGAAWPIGVPGLALTTEFRFIGQFETQNYGGTTYATGTRGNYGAVGTTVKVAAPTNESFMIGIRYAFNAAPPPPPPMAAPVAAPAPAPARTYLVFFDWDKADLSARAHQIIAEAAQNSTRVQVTKIEVDGYADRTGTAQYNVVLSRKRADNVAADLVKDGVPKNIISIQAFGDTHLLVPTAAGVREPQNRRVEIILK
jgi:outer membrane protein OmpA-like peptidoglycan-associated protein